MLDRPADPLEPNHRLQEFIDYIRTLDATSPQECIPSWATNEIASAFDLPLMGLDRDPMVQLGDLGERYLDLLGKLAGSPDPEVRGSLPDAVYGLTAMAVGELREMYQRDAGGPRPSPAP